jgi:DNA-binding response OmpR family regulator
MAQKAHQRVQKQLDNVTILVVEDEPIIALDLQFLLEASGARPVALEHGMEGARQRLAGPDLPDVVILDLILGGKSSLPLAEELRQLNVPFLFLTGDPIGIPPGFADISTIEKPFDADQLIATVGAVASNHRFVSQIRSSRTAGE